MELTAQMLTDVIESLRSNPPAGQEKRKQPRVGLSAQVEILISGETTPRIERLRDVSEGGIGLLTHRQFTRGLEFMLLLRDSNGIVKFTRCTTCHCRKVGSGLYNVGASFVSGIQDLNQG